MENFNKKVSLCLKDCKLFENNNVNLKDVNQLLFKTNEEYQKSFSDIEEFSKTIKDTDKKKIDAVIYHDQNQDGLFSALVLYQFLVDKKVDVNNVQFIPMKPASGNKADKRLDKIIDKISGKNVLICDIQYSLANLEVIANFAKKLYIIDDHPRNSNERKSLNNLDKLKGNYFIGNNQHSACAYTWKFFFPKKDVPIFIQVTDNNDIKLQLPFLKQFARPIYSFFDFRMVHHPLKKFDSVQSFEALNDFVSNTDKNLYYIIGHYYDEVVNNIKLQVAQNASVQNFLGYRVMILNYNDPVLSTMVQRQMMTNAEKKNEKIDFAVLWGYEYTSQAYRISMSEKHTGGKPQYNLEGMGRALGKFFGSPRGGGGKRFIGNFYLPRGKYDIWDLMTKSDEILKKAGFRK